MKKITLYKLQTERIKSIANMRKLDKLKGISAMETFENIQDLGKTITKEEYLKMKEKERLCTYNFYKYMGNSYKEEVEEYITKLEILAGVRNG